MANLVQARRRLTWTMIALGILDVIAVVVLASPLVISPAARTQEFNTVRANVLAKQRQVVPPDQVQMRVEEARKQIDAFYRDRLPSENSSISEQLGKLANDNHVKLTQAKYDPEDTEVSGLRRIKIDASLAGNYVDEVKFINALERSKMFFLVDSVTLGEQQAGVVRVALRLETYVKGKA